MDLSAKVWVSTRQVGTKKGVGIKTADVFNDVPRVTVPVRHPAICFYPIHKCTTGILQRDG